ncbi:hypothetical protein Ga0100231_007715 [Opitutaceae bacterium TAV4]|nr:hypothetical protein Ga0100231_007715 [Opitutaceae bacterium TAV4]RRJ98356.1 hypothetical protein Ga0100230_007985 [Opitutaceae bacterium TAV3]
MNKFIVTTFLTVISVGALHAQSITRNNNTASLLGQRYVTAEAEYFDIDSSNINHGGALGINLPIAANFDALFRYNYAWEDGHTSQEEQTATAGINAWYDAAASLRVFAGGDLGYTWGDAVAKDDWFYRVRAGGEYTLTSSLSLLAYATWSDGLDHHIADYWSGTAQAAYWLSSQIAVTARAIWIEGGDFAYGLGVLFKF